MENNESKTKYIGELTAIVFLEIIMLLFRLVQPISWPNQMPLSLRQAGNEWVCFAIELILVIVIVGHLIFKKSYRELGLCKFKENIGSLTLNVSFAVVCIAGAYFTSQFSKLVEVDLVQVVLMLITNFIAIAFIKELIFRGFLFNSVLGMTGNKGIIAVLVSAFLFTLSYIPEMLMSLNEVSVSSITASLAGPLIFGLYLSILYYYTKNLWSCVIIHGTALTFTIVESDFFMTVLIGVYAVCLLIYLLVKIRNYYRENSDGAEESLDLDTKYEADELQLPVEVMRENQEVVEEREKELDEKEPVLAAQELSQEEIIQNEQPGVQEEVGAHESKIIEIPSFKEERVKQFIEETHKNNIADSEEEDLEQAAFIPNTKEELGKVVNLQARREQLVRKGRKDVNFDDTIIIPCISDKSNNIKKDSVINLEGSHQITEAEPNFIAHLEEHLGEFEGIYKQTEPSNPVIDVMYFVNDRYEALVTNGMRNYNMSVPNELSEYNRAELMVFIDPSMNICQNGTLRKEDTWLIKLLTDLAVYPASTNSYLGWGHIVGNGECLENYDESVEYCGALIYPPMDQQDIKFYRYEEKGQSTYIYNVMPLYKEELIFIQEHSSDQFISLMNELGIKQSIMRNRVNVITALNNKM